MAEVSTGTSAAGSGLARSGPIVTECSGRPARPGVGNRYRSNTFSIRTRRPSTVSYHSCCFKACFMLRIRCRTRVPVSTSISTNFGTSTIPVDGWDLIPGVRKVWFCSGDGMAPPDPAAAVQPTPTAPSPGSSGERLRPDPGERSSEASRKVYRQTYHLYLEVRSYAGICVLWTLRASIPGGRAKHARRRAFLQRGVSDGGREAGRRPTGAPAGEAPGLGSVPLGQVIPPDERNFSIRVCER